MTKPVVVFLDIETSPNLSFIWGQYEQDALDVKEHWHVICFSAKFQGGKHIVRGLDDYPGYQKDPESDKALIDDIWEVLNKADIVVAHNGDNFDIKKINSRFVYWRKAPPSPYQTVDTLKMARGYFGFDSNKLGDLGRFLGLGEKVHTGGYELWRGCMAGDSNAWRKMKRYNKHDVTLLEKVYLVLRPYAKNHVNVATFFDRADQVCPRCGSRKAQSRGWLVKLLGKRKRYQCQDCGGWFVSAENEMAQRPSRPA